MRLRGFTKNGVREACTVNTGKIFEEQWKKSMPDYAVSIRLRDSAQSFGGVSKLRFSLKNPCDFILWDSRNKNLYMLELKTKEGTSISFERTECEEGTRDIHWHQIASLLEFAKYNITCGFVIEFRKIETTVFLKIDEFMRLIQLIPKKSFNYNDLIENNITYEVIPQKKLRTRFLYSVNEFLDKNIGGR